jgi:peptidoglycan/LPS O-acetylase OafA/YrhL
MTQKLELHPARNQGSTKTKKKPVFRPDIQGLRAVAVLSVIADHTFSYPRGGFIGVDVFFVISGFLITGLLLREHERSGRISFADFYRKRARRILPLAVLVLVATVSATWAVFTSGRAMGITWDAVWSMVFGTNWHLALAGTDYMQADGLVSPLQHFWSLAVEEQFYVVWPWLLVLVLGGAARKGWSHGRGRLVLTAVMAVLVAAALAWAMWETATSPTVAYFSTFSRAWELGIGAVLAASAGALAKLPQLLRPILGYVGLAGIVWSIFNITPEMPFPAPWAVVPVLATALVIAAGTGGEVRFLYPLTNPVSRYIGDVSYSLYLWHFPVIVLFAAVLPFEGAAMFAVVLAATGVLSVLSYHLLEDPIRKSSWLEPGRDKRREYFDRSRAAISGLVALGLVTGVVVGAALARDAGLHHPTAAAPVKAVATDKKVADTPETRLTALVDKALAAPEWPALTPAVEELGNKAKAPEWINDGCLGGDSASLEDDEAKAETCVYGPESAKKTAVLIGDSIGISYAPALRAAVESKGYKVMVFTMQQCPAVSVTVKRGDGSDHPRCDPFREWAFGKVKEMKPDILVLASSEDATMRLVSGAEGPAIMTEWRAGLDKTVAAVAGAAKKTFILDPPPGGANLQDCATRLSKPSDCVTEPSQRYRELALAASQVTKITPVSTEAWFCSAGACPAFAGKTPVYADTGHMTGTYSKSLGPVLAAVLKP